jgi:hypothetical protein
MAFVRKVPTDPDRTTRRRTHARSRETDSCGRFHSAAEGGRMRGDGRALVPRTDSSVRTSVPVGTRAGRRRRARVDLAAAHAREPRPSQRRSSPPRVCAVGEARRARRALTLEGATRACQCQWDIRCGALPHAERSVWLWWTIERASLEASLRLGRKPSRRSIAAGPAISIGMQRRARLSDVYIATLAFTLATGARGFESCSF